MFVVSPYRVVKVLFIATVLLIVSCTKGADPDASTAVPNVSVNITLNINNSPYTYLKNIGGVAYASGGYRGIMLYRASSSTIIAMDRTCTYDLPDANGIVQAQSNGTAICLDCSSTYNLNGGGLLSGPSTMGLKEYNTSFNSLSGQLTITN